ncbi:MAG TPA: adenylate/guanylate cyclase domain-containing protein [Hanamia sp.]|nr:adenylate/guanylate cyclase domain-containing protein [Hanamia sp.]
MVKILVVDDETDLELLIKQRFRKQIREKSYEFVFAVNGKDALKQISEHPDIAIVLTDINMPEMDGLTLLSKLNETSPLIKSVIVSAYGDMDNIRAAMNRGAFDFLCKPINFGDLDLTLQKTIVYVDQIHQTLIAIKENNILKMYVDKSVLDFMDGHEFEASFLVNEIIESTVVFIDICNFTSISETEPPDKVVQLLNRLFDVMVKEILAQNGSVDKFIGDAIMAVFKNEYHLDRAIEASLAVRKKIEELPVQADLLNFLPRVAIGINSGEMISGNIGSANLRRLDYTVIGDSVNTSQRLQSAAKAGQILISENSYNKVKESFNCNKVGDVKLKNKSKTMVIYEVLD